MIYDKVIDGIQNKTLEGSFNAVFFRAKDNYFGCYTISSPDLEDLYEDPEYISIRFEGGHLFAFSSDILSDGEEDFYSLEDVPDEAKSLLYISENEFSVDSHISGYLAEYALFNLFPTLYNPDDVWSDSDKVDFIESVKEHFLKNSDKVTLLV